MFGKKKNQNREMKAKERMVRKVLGKDSGRRVFGFPCSPNIKVSMKSLADQMHVWIYALSEHALQLGAMQIEAAMTDPEERELLRSHVTEVHQEMRTIEKVARYDEQAAEDMKMERIRRFSIEKATRQLVMKYCRLGVKPEELEDIIQFGYQCSLAIKRGWPCPPEVSFHK
jgi:hypothetical protein